MEELGGMWQLLGSTTGTVPRLKNPQSRDSTGCGRSEFSLCPTPLLDLGLDLAWSSPSTEESRVYLGLLSMGENYSCLVCTRILTH